jgi:hypothetical protein
MISPIAGFCLCRPAPDSNASKIEGKGTLPYRLPFL